MRFLRNRNNKIFFIFAVFMGIIFTAVGLLNSFEAGGLLCVASLFFILLLLIEQKNRYSQIEKIIEDIDNILHNDEFVSLDYMVEGELAVLCSEIKKMTVKLRESAYLLQREKINLTDAISDISHQLRTPLTTINMQVSFLQDRDITEQDRNIYLKNINVHLRRIDWLIASLLKISKLDAGTIKLKKEEIGLDELIEKSIESLLIPIEIKEQMISYIAYGNEKLKCDINWSIEAISNIVKNCMEHTDIGGKLLIMGEENPIYTKITIQDNGIGISDVDLPHIFERFYKGKNSDNNSVGIGLALAKMIIQRQNGSLKAENAREGGAKFIIKFYKGIDYGSSENR